ncbi:MAG: DNRLRE domain-containing protein [Pontiellaceae bacterium]|nr:DNRLRE domain-containing protein [Pontiellaceae bacterium]
MKKSVLFIAAALLLAGGLTANGSTDGDTGPMVWAVYYPWFRDVYPFDPGVPRNSVENLTRDRIDLKNRVKADWLAEFTDNPIGPADMGGYGMFSYDKIALKLQVEQALDAGIDGFITYYRGLDKSTGYKLPHFTEGAIKLLFEAVNEVNAARGTNFRIAMHLSVQAAYEQRDGKSAPDRLAEWTDRFLAQFGAENALMRIDGKMLAVAYSTAYNGYFPPSSWSIYRSKFKDKLYMVADNGSANDYADYLTHFDGTINRSLSDDATSISNFLKRGQNVAASGKLWGGEVRPNEKNVNSQRNNTAFFTATFSRAAAIGARNFLRIVSWNEYAEFTHIEPSKNYGQRFLTAAKTEIEKWKTTTAASCHIDVPTGNVTVSSGSSLLVKVSASDPDGVERVKLFNGTTELMSDSSSPYEMTLTNLTASFTLTAKVKDLLGNYTTSDNSRVITVGGTQTATVPWVTNLTLSAAGTSLTNAGLVVGNVSSNYHATVAAGRIFSQTPGGGVVTNRGSPVDLAVSRGPSTGTTVTFYSVGVHDGYVDESSETSNVGGTNNATLTTGTALRVGDTGARKQRKSIVSFDTSTLPDTAVVTAATLKLKRGGGIGTPTGLGLLTVDIKNVPAGFGTSLNLENIDFEYAASKSDVGTLSYPAATNAWAIAALNTNGTARIAKTNHTQFRIRFATDDDNDTADDYLGFYSGENASSTNRPILEVTYQ